MEFILALLIALEPSRIDPPARGPGYQFSPAFPARCQWGTITHRSGKIEIAGPHGWKAAGRYLKPGIALIEWTQLSDGKRGIAVYYHDSKTGQWPGAWGWQGECQVNADGSIEGSIAQETISDDR